MCTVNMLVVRAIALGIDHQLVTVITLLVRIMHIREIVISTESTSDLSVGVPLSHAVATAILILVSITNTTALATNTTSKSALMAHAEVSDHQPMTAITLYVSITRFVRPAIIKEHMLDVRDRV